MPRLRLILILCGVFLLAGALISAQDSDTVFATNTPPPPPLPEPMISTPSALANDYGLRRWQEAELVNLLRIHVQRLTPNATQQQQAIRLLQFELEQRFQGAPRDPSQREGLLQAMLDAPRGSVDMRAVIHPILEEGLNQNNGQSTFLYNGFLVEVESINLDGRDEADTMIHARYSLSDDETIYDDYLLARRVGARYEVLPTAHLLPVAPLGDVRSVTLVQVADFNGDSVQEVVVRAQTDDINEQLFIVGARGDTAVSLVEPGQNIVFGSLDNLEVGRIDTTVYRIESPAWGCLGEQSVTWNWERNFFRPSPSADGYFFQNSANCLFYGLEPYFEVPVDDAIDKLDSVLSLAPADHEGVQRARMIRAMLDLLNGDMNAAGAQVLQLVDEAQPGSWLDAQTRAFLTASAQPDIQPLRICAALQTASDYGACDVEQVLKRLFAEQPLKRGEPINEQLAELGITVLDSFTVSTLGRADREGVFFELAGNHWWAFAALEPDFYTAEPLDAPASSNVPPTLTISPTPEMIAALLNNNPAQVLTLLSNLQRESPNALIAADTRYIVAFSYDLLGNRDEARTRYYEIWRDLPQTIWGQLAAAHLQQG